MAVPKPLAIKSTTLDLGTFIIFSSFIFLLFYELDYIIRPFGFELKGKKFVGGTLHDAQKISYKIPGELFIFKSQIYLK